VPENPNRLTLEIQGTRIPASRFKAGFQAFLSEINAVADEIAGKRNAIDWYLTLEPGSAIVHFDPEARAMDESEIRGAFEVIREGMVALEARHEVWPAHYTESALRSHRTLARVLADGNGDLESVRVRFERTPQEITTRAAANIDALLKTEYTAWGTLEGRLEVISRRGGFKFSVHDGMTEQPINCIFEESFLDEAIDAFRTNCRVSVYGQISYRASGMPNRITVEEIGKLKPPDELPTFRDVLGILKEE